MGIYRTYFDKNNTIVKDSNVNTGRNQVSELYFGDLISRFLFYCSFDEVINLVNSGVINPNGNVKHILTIKNTSNFDIKDILSIDNNLMFGSYFRPTSFDLELHDVNELWDEGNGYDFVTGIQSFPQNIEYILGPSNWINATNVTNFNTPGVISGGTNPIAVQHLGFGNEDIKMDVTNFVNSIISGATTGTTYNGFCLKYSDAIEALTFPDNRVCALGLFTRHTQTFFEPYIETIYDDHIDDERISFYLGKENKLFFYSVINGKLENLDQVPTCTINGTGYTVNQKTKGVYYVTVDGDESNFVSYTEYNDIWSGIVYNGNARPNVKLRFVPIDADRYYNFNMDALDDTRYGLSLSGIKVGESLQQGEQRKVNILLRKPYTVSEYYVSNSVYYKLYVKQGPAIIDIFDWQPANKALNNNYFTIDTTWLVPQRYFVDIKIETNGETTLHGNELHFDVVNKA
jgi:hypothetical protein